MLFLDGGHTLEIVQNDIKKFMPKLKIGGILAMHDYGDYYEGPRKVWDILVKDKAIDPKGQISSLVFGRKNWVPSHPLFKPCKGGVKLE